MYLKRNEHVTYTKRKASTLGLIKIIAGHVYRVAATISKFKTTFSSTLLSRKGQSQKNEITLKCKILNVFAALTLLALNGAA